MSLSPLEIAVLNNVTWYQELFDAHGIASTTDDVAWQTTQTPPPFHSSMVVRSMHASTEEVKQRVRLLAAPCSSTGWGMKDSYSCLDLAELGFETVFNAQWLWLPPDAAVPPSRRGEYAWSRIDSPAHLAAWEHAWAGAPINVVAGDRPRQFPVKLLHNPNFVFLAARLQGRIVGGGVVNRSPGAAGLSNFFTSATGPRNVWPALIELGREAFPGLPLVGYSRGEELLQAREAGFKTIGDLRVLHLPASRCNTAS